jgi:hypothetical protein
MLCTGSPVSEKASSRKFVNRAAFGTLSRVLLGPITRVLNAYRGGIIQLRSVHV